MDNYEFIKQFIFKKFNTNELKILDYGCGSGKLFNKLIAEGLDVKGCDAFFMTDTAPEKYIENSKDYGVNIFNMPDGLIPFKDETFDLVVNNQVLEHVENIDLTLSEINRVLKPGGFVLSLFPDRGVFREGHLGIAFSHWFPKYSKIRWFYLLLFRAMGFGYHKKKYGNIFQWTNNRSSYLDLQTFYRSYPMIVKFFKRYFFNITHYEVIYGRMRYDSLLIKIIPDSVLSFLIRKGGGLVFMAEKQKNNE